MVGSNAALVTRVMSFESSSSVYPTASLAAVLAIGKPVALEASAELRDTRGFISMTTSRPVCGWTANWMFEPPVSTPIARMQATAASRMIWYSLSVSVWAGATVIESPVCTPMGSKFSIEHTMTTLSRPSRITSSSNSFQPAIDSSTRISCTGEASRPDRKSTRLNSSHTVISYAVFCLKKKKKKNNTYNQNKTTTQKPFTSDASPRSRNTLVVKGLGRCNGSDEAYMSGP